MKKLVSCFLFVAMLLGSVVWAQTPPPTYTTYIVAQGDTIGRIAVHFNTTTVAIMKANQISDPNLIYPGELLLIPIPSTGGSSPATSGAPTLRPAPTLPPTPTPQSSPTEVVPIATFEAGTPMVVAPPDQATQPVEAQSTTVPTIEPTTVPTTVPATEQPTVAAATAEVTQQASPATQQASSIGFAWGGEVSGFKHLDTMSASGMTWAEVRVVWKEGDPVNTVKRAIDQVHASKLKVLVQISGDPKEMAADFTHYSADYVAYLGSVAALAPDAIEVWRDENIPAGWSSGQIDPTAYVQLLTDAYRAIKQANGSVLVISGALGQSIAFDGKCTPTGCADAAYLQAMADAGAAQAADCIGLRYTLGAVAPDATSGDTRGSDYIYYYQSVVSTYANIFPSKPLCFTELGYLIPSKPNQNQWAAKTTAQNQADWIAGAAQLADQSGRVLLLIVYNIDISNGTAGDYAVLKSDGTCLTCDSLNYTLRG